MTERKTLKIVFMGTPDFAVSSLDALIQSNHTVAGVVTSPDKPSGRGLTLQSSAVKKYAEQHNMYVLQPEKLKDESFLKELSALSPDVIVVVAFRMLPEVVWSMPPLGTINLHASLLPQYRGAAPINWAIINGETETGVTTFLISHHIDTGDMLKQRKVPIAWEDDAGTLHDKLMKEGANLLVETLDEMSEGKIHPIKQTLVPGMELKTAPKIFRENCQINWAKTSDEVYNLIRGLHPNPSAWTILEGNNRKISMKILKSMKTGMEENNEIPGTISISKEKRMFVKCGLGGIEVVTLQPEGKKTMPAASYIRGLQLPETDEGTGIIKGLRFQ
jgi:methionyl-tRNA formyltransferase